MADKNYSQSVKFNTEGIRNNLKMLKKKNREAVLSHMQTMCKERITPYAKKNAPWRDRTGNARRTLEATAKLKGRVVQNVEVTLSHGVWYGYRLETWFNKRYEIIWPTIRALSPEITRTYNNFLSKLKL